MRAIEFLRTARREDCGPARQGVPAYIPHGGMPWHAMACQGMPRHATWRAWHATCATQ